jgi:ABC-type branched-subunit amino acid transport system substrate-binding protein
MSGAAAKWGLAGLLVVAFLSGCRFGVAPVVKIGLVAPFEGQHRPVGYDVIYSARLAVREINAVGGIGGYRIALAALDDSGAPDLAAAAAGSLVIDPAVVVAIGHWLTATTQAGLAVYHAGSLPVVTTSQRPFRPADPGQLPLDFLTNYALVTPFDEAPGPYAGPAYDAMYLVFAAMARAADETGQISRDSLATTLSETTIQGITGVVFQP